MPVKNLSPPYCGNDSGGRLFISKTKHTDMADPKKKKQVPEDKQEFPGYPHYDAEEDIYAQEDKIPDERTGQDPAGEENPAMDVGLDVPGAELDDASEAIGTEDEENNYYSLGGDNHDDLEESDDTL